MYCYILADRFGGVLPKLGQLVELFMETILLLEFFLISCNDICLQCIIAVASHLSMDYLSVPKNCYDVTSHVNTHVLQYRLQHIHTDEDTFMVC